jgi:hypothetical protein
MDIEVPAENPRSFSNIRRRHHHLLKLETVSMSIYYPSDFGSGPGRDPAGHKHWSRDTWLPRPRLQLAQGHSKFAVLAEPSLVPFFAATTMFTKIPAFRNARPANHWPSADNTKKQSYMSKASKGPSQTGDREAPRFPLLIFSQGIMYDILGTALRPLEGELRNSICRPLSSFLVSIVKTSCTGRKLRHGPFVDERGERTWLPIVAPHSSRYCSNIAV